jgi:hypothetical protein
LKNNQAVRNIQLAEVKRTGPILAVQENPVAVLACSVTPRYSRRISQPATGALKMYAKCRIPCANTHPRAIAPTKLVTRALFNRLNMSPPGWVVAVTGQTVDRPCTVDPPRQKPGCEKLTTARYKSADAVANMKGSASISVGEKYGISKMATAVNKKPTARETGIHRAWNAPSRDHNSSTAIVTAAMWESSRIWRRERFIISKQCFVWAHSNGLLL